MTNIYLLMAESSPVFAYPTLEAAEDALLALRDQRDDLSIEEIPIGVSPASIITTIARAPMDDLEAGQAVVEFFDTIMTRRQSLSTTVTMERDGFVTGVGRSRDEAMSSLLSRAGIMQAVINKTGLVLRAA